MPGRVAIPKLPGYTVSSPVSKHLVGVLQAQRTHSAVLELSPRPVRRGVVALDDSQHSADGLHTLCAVHSAAL